MFSNNIKKMKKLSTLLLLTLFVGALQAQVIEPEMTFKKKTHDFGTVCQDTCVVTCTFTFRNTGDGPLVIHQAATSCGCTVPEYTQEPIAPGATGTINVTYNGKTKRPGVFKKSITIHSNAKNTPVRIYIQGEMIPSADYEEILLDDGTIADSPVYRQDLEPEEKEPVVETITPTDKKAAAKAKKAQKATKKATKKTTTPSKKAK